MDWAKSSERWYDRAQELEADLEAAERRVEEARHMLEEMASFAPSEVVIDDFAYYRLREAFQQGARNILAALSTTEEPKEEPCPDCGGTGQRSEWFGEGEMRGGNIYRCPTCKGTGKREAA